MKSTEYHSIGNEPLFASLRGNEPFTLFLMILRFSNDDDMFRQFSCSECESTYVNGTKWIEIFFCPPFIAIDSLRDVNTIPIAIQLGRGVENFTHCLRDANSQGGANANHM